MNRPVLDRRSFVTLAGAGRSSWEELDFIFARCAATSRCRRRTIPACVRASRTKRGSIHRKSCMPGSLRAIRCAQSLQMPSLFSRESSTSCTNVS